MTRRNEFSAKTKAAVLKRSGGNCEVEGCFNLAAEIDHIVECWEDENGGDNSLENAMHLCRECHKMKTANSMKLKAWGNHFRPRIVSICEKRAAKASKKSSSIPSSPFPKSDRPSVLSKSNPFYRKQKFS